MAQVKNEHRTPVAGWFMHTPFQASLVYSRLSAVDYDFIVGLDVGHGETIAYMFSTEQATDENGATVSQPKVERLRLNHEDDAKVPTLLRFSGNQVIVGKKAKNVPGFFQHFKTEPEKWDTKIDGVHTHGELMDAFIRTLWKQILQYQPKLAEAVSQDRVLVTVGCPASDAWTSSEAMDRYEKLLRRATKCAHVSVLPESTAAIMAAVLSAEETVPKYKLALEQGVAVLDAGSSTLDFTYVKMGKTLITRSLRLGGHDLDEQMLEVAMEDSGLTRDQIPTEQRQTLLVQLREMKEAFYPNRESLGIQVIPIWGVDEAGRADGDLPSNLQLKFTLNAAFMERALNRKEIQLHGHLSAKQSWLELCGEFVQFTKALADSCDKVVLTGGTSFVTELSDTVRRSYGDRVIQSRDPSSSVAKGLCYAKSLEVRGKDHVSAYKAHVDKVSNRGYESFADELAHHITHVVFDGMKDSAASLAEQGETVTVERFISDVNERVRSDDRLVGDAGRQTVQNLFAKQFSSIVSNLYEEANKISSDIYGANLDSVPKLTRLTREQMDAIFQNINLNSAINKAWITVISRTFFSVFLNILYWTVLVLTLTMQLPAAGAIAALAMTLEREDFQEKAVEFFKRNNTKIKTSLLNKIIHRLTDVKSRAKNEDKTAAKTVKAVKNAGIFREEFKSSIEIQAEMALGKVLFLVYDNKPS